MKKSPYTVVLAIGFLLTLCQAAQRPEVSSGVTVIEGATVIDGVSSSSIQDAILVMEGDTIRNVGKRGSFPIPPNARTIPAAGKTILPGIFNLHGHIGLVEGMETKRENYSPARIQRDANAYLYYGVTQMLSLGMDFEPMLAFQADQRSGKAGGARIHFAGQGFAAKDGWRPEGIADINRPTTPEEARAFVQKEIKKPVDVIKIWMDDNYGALPKLSPELYGAIIAEAHRHKVRVLAHVKTLEDAKGLARAGVDALAHSVRDKEVDTEFLRLAKQQGVTQVGTLVGHQADIAYAEGAPFLKDPGLPLLFSPVVLRTLGSKEYQQKLANAPALARSRAEFEIAMKNIAKISAAGIPIVVGTDSGPAGHFQGLWEHREMELLVKAGLSPMQAIQAATINGARFLRLDKQYGSLEPRKVADFIVLNADPLSDITNTRKIASVWMNGKQVDRAALALR